MDTCTTASEATPGDPVVQQTGVAMEMDVTPDTEIETVEMDES
jgi:hypothetical protein